MKADDPGPESSHSQGYQSIRPVDEQRVFRKIQIFKFFLNKKTSGSCITKYEKRVLSERVPLRIHPSHPDRYPFFLSLPIVLERDLSGVAHCKYGIVIINLTTL